MFLIGEFSKISQVSKRLLHHYDDIGLLKPAHTDKATNYRYYSAKQLLRLNRILVLKDLGLALNQIASMLQAEVSDDEIHGMLLMKKAEVEKAVQEDLRRLHKIEARLLQNQAVDDTPDVVIKSIPVQPFLSVRKVFPTKQEVLQLVESMLRDIPDKVDLGILGAFAGIVHTESFTQFNNDIDFGYFLKKKITQPVQLTQDCVLLMHELPAVQTMATSVQVGDPDLIFITLGKIAQWIEANGYRISGPFREIGFDISSFNQIEEAVIEVQMPIESY